MRGPPTTHPTRGPNSGLWSAKQKGGCRQLLWAPPSQPRIPPYCCEELSKHTNHFIAEPGRLDDTMVRLGPDSVLRLDHARRGMARLTEGTIDEDSILGVMHSHRGGSGAICCHPAPDAPFGDRWQTLATITVRPSRREMAVRRGGPCQWWSTAHRKGRHMG